MKTAVAQKPDMIELAQQRPEFRNYTSHFISTKDRIWVMKSGRPIEVFRRDEDGMYESIFVLHQLLPDNNVIFLEAADDLIFIASGTRIISVKCAPKDHYRLEKDHSDPTWKFDCIDLQELTGTQCSMIIALFNARSEDGYMIRAIHGATSGTRGRRIKT